MNFHEMNIKSFELEGQIVDIQNNKIFPGKVVVENGIITAILEKENTVAEYILPGFIDSHIHIESSMLVPYEFARKALTHGTIATISDPHEIANVCGLRGVDYMLENARNAFLHFHFGAPSCVPATTFETAGATLDADDVDHLLSNPEIIYLSEMMNYPGVLHGDEQVLKKIASAKKYGKPVDGHAPGLTGEDAIKYINAGISTDHECFTKEEALFKLNHGMKILIREGSAARNFEALHELIREYTDMVMFCSDDKHPDELMHGHINQIVQRAIAKGHDLFKVLKCACINPVFHYGLKTGMLREGDPANFIVTENLKDFQIKKTYIDGMLVAENGMCSLPPGNHPVINNFSAKEITPDDIAVKANGNTLNIIEAIDGQLITQKVTAPISKTEDYLSSDIKTDCLKLVVVNRYSDVPPATAFIKNFKLQSGALASTVAHDSHNIIAVGTTDELICTAVNELIKHKGGLSVSDSDGCDILPLPVGGLMSSLDCETVAENYTRLDKKVKAMGCELRAPFMTLSFMALLVIPSLKLSDKGLFDGSAFRFTELQTP